MKNNNSDFTDQPKTITDYANNIETMDLEVISEDFEKFQNILDTYLTNNELTISEAVKRIGMKKVKRLYEDLLECTYDYQL